MLEQWSSEVRGIVADNKQGSGVNGASIFLVGRSPALQPDGLERVGICLELPGRLFRHARVAVAEARR